MRAVRLWMPALLLAMAARGSLAAAGTDNTIVVASTTSMQDSGLYDFLLPIFTRKTGMTVKIIAQGTGQALDTARRGDADMVLVHAEAAELQFMKDGDGIDRHPLMYDDFVLLGPKADPAGVKDQKDITQAFRALALTRAAFISRGDRSGTHIAELGYWNAAGIDLDRDKGTWYRSIGQGMGAALNIASASAAYVLSDRPSWLNFGNKGELVILVEGDPRLFNQYSVILVNPAKHPTVKNDLARRFRDYLVSPSGQADIAHYQIGGVQAFHPNASRANP